MSGWHKQMPGWKSSEQKKILIIDKRVLGSHMGLTPRLGLSEASVMLSKMDLPLFPSGWATAPSPQPPISHLALALLGEATVKSEVRGPGAELK